MKSGKRFFSRWMDGWIPMEMPLGSSTTFRKTRPSWGMSCSRESLFRTLGTMQLRTLPGKGHQLDTHSSTGPLWGGGGTGRVHWNFWSHFYGNLIAYADEFAAPRYLGSSVKVLHRVRISIVNFFSSVAFLKFKIFGINSQERRIPVGAGRDKRHA